MKPVYSNNYQLVVLYPATTEEKKQKEDLASVKGEIEKADMKVSFADWGEKELVYAIEGNKKARFWIGSVEASDKVSTPWKSVRIFLNRDKQIIRYLILKI
jgi:ribosomal protein S6